MPALLPFLACSVTPTQKPLLHSLKEQSEREREKEGIKEG